MAKRKKSHLTVDFEGVSVNQLIKEGIYLVKVLKVEVKESPNRPEPYLAWEFAIVDGQGSIGSHLFDNTSTSPKALWRLRKRLENMGFDIPDGPMEIDPLAFVDEQLTVKVAHEEYQDKKKAVIVDDMPADEYDS